MLLVLLIGLLVLLALVLLLSKLLLLLLMRWLGAIDRDVGLRIPEMVPDYLGVVRRLIDLRSIAAVHRRGSRYGARSPSRRNNGNEGNRAARTSTQTDWV